MIRDIVKLMGVLMLAGASSAIAGAPTAIANNTGYSAACYDFNDYIPSTDSPVVGGASVLRTKSGYGQGRFATHFFGKVCTSTPLNYAPGSWAAIGYLTYYGSYSSEWYNSGPSEQEVVCLIPNYYGGACYGDVPEPALKVVCPFNTAPIKVSGYTRSDGGATWTNVHGYDVGSAAAWYDPRAISGVTSAMETILCVKTDTMQP